MSTRLVLKLIAIVVLTVLLIVPLALISGVLDDRVEQRHKAKESVMESTSGPQRLSGVALVMPYTTLKLVKKTVPTKMRVQVPPQLAHDTPETLAASTRRALLDQAARAERARLQEKSARAAGVAARRTTSKKKAPQDGAETFVLRTVMKEVTTKVITHHKLVLLPDSLAISGDVKATKRFRGIYGVPVFAAALTISGAFDVDVGDLARDNVTFGTPVLAVGISDVRGLRTTPSLRWQEGQMRVRPGAQIAALGEGVHVPLPSFDPKKKGRKTFSLPLDLAGATKLSFTPMGRSAQIKLRADWPHPSFYGRFLPTHRSIDDSGFDATWETTTLATNLTTRFMQVYQAGGLLPPSQDVGVELVEPVDHYSQTERAIKYALLFILLTFGSFFLFEMVRHLRIHPMQYALVGCALAVFYLLVVALSEHMDFVIAYAVASAACVGLIGFYLSHVLHHWRRGIGFGLGLGGLYAALFGILQSEDHALLMGSLLVFGALAAVMALTRRLDWYAVAAPPVASAVASAVSPDAG